MRQRMSAWLIESIWSTYRLPGKENNSASRSDSQDALDGMAIRSNVIDPDPDKIATTQLAIDRKIEQRQIANLSVDLQPGSDCPDVFLP
jgi:hypothetical protein